MKTQVFKDYQAFLDREYKTINGVSEEFAAINPDHVADNKTNYGCWNCTGCTGCISCIDCIDCIDCTSCTHCIGCTG